MTRKFHIESFKNPVAMDPKYSDKTWKSLEHAIDAIYNNKACALSYQDLYRNAYNMVLHEFGEKLYSGLVTTMTSHLKQIARSIEATEGSSFLEELNRKWDEHYNAVEKIGDILMYMDRTYVRKTKKAPVCELGMDLWRQKVLYSKPTRSRLLDMLLELVRSERSGEVIDRGLFCHIIIMLIKLGCSVYEQEFETPFLEASVEFYKVESQKFIESCDCGDYLKEAERCLKEEMDRASHCLYPDTEGKITNVVVKEMIENHMLRLIHMEKSGLVNMLCDDKYEDLSRMYNFFGRVPDGLSNICEVMASHIRKSGKQFVADPEKLKDPVEFVQRLLDEKDKYDKIIKLAFNDNRLFQKALKSSFEFFINLNPCSPKFVSLFVEDKLRKGLKGIDKDDREITLGKVMILFRYLQDKDMFEKYYKQNLAKRLMFGVTVVDDAERSLIVKLKMECGHHYTFKIEGMFKDLETSLHTIRGFYASHPELGDGPTLTVKVLTRGFWPIQSSATINLPAEISALCDKFQSYYLETHTGRKLSWQTNMGTADLKATFGKGQRCELYVSAYQMCVLMLFNNADRLSYLEIEEATRIPPSDLKRCLQSLALVKERSVLRMEPMSKDIGEDHAFFVNEEFSIKKDKVKLIGTVVPHNESEPEKLKTLQGMDEERKHHIEAAIVRIMKFRKVLDHNNLTAEVTKQLQSHFLAKPIEVKKRIESLMEREFLERDMVDRKLYRYLA